MIPPWLSEHATLIRLAGLVIALTALVIIAAIPALFALNFIPLPVNAIWDKILRNMGYSITAGALLILIVAIFDLLKAQVNAQQS